MSATWTNSSPEKRGGFTIYAAYARDAEEAAPVRRDAEPDSDYAPVARDAEVDGGLIAHEDPQIKC